MSSKKEGKLVGAAHFTQFLELVVGPKRPITKNQAKTAGKELQETWAQRPDKLLANAHRHDTEIKLELEMLARVDDGGSDHANACTLIRTLGQDAPTSLTDHALFEAVMTSLTTAVGITATA